MPMRARSLGRLVLALSTAMPATSMWPCSNGSRPLTHLISVDLPEPEGPHTTTTSPLSTWVVQSFSAWKLGPYHLSTWLIWIMKVSLAENGDARLQAADAKGRGEGNREIDYRCEKIHLDQPAVALR